MKSEPPFWSAADERQHPDSKQEWWSVETFLKGPQGEPWSLRAYIWEYVEKKQPKTFFIMTVTQETTGKHYTYTYEENTRRISSEESLNVRCQASYMQGRFPHYTMVFHDPDHDIEAVLNWSAASQPHWVTQDATDGWLPLGLGVFRYGYIPKLLVTGTLKIQGNTLAVSGVGYFEHIWGDFSYINLLSFASLRRIVGTYAALVRWWITQNRKRLRVPRSLLFTSENNPIGNDWAWAVLDNGWTIFYGNIMLWLMEGPAMGILILSKDGETFKEYGSLSFRYPTVRHNTTYDFMYPRVLEVTAHHHDETLSLRFSMNLAHEESIDVFSKDKHWVSLVVCENPGEVHGWYRNGSETVPLNGMCKLELQRQVSSRGHASLRIDFVRPPDGFGFTFDLIAHFFQKRMQGVVQLLPTPRLRLSIRRISSDVIPEVNLLEKS